MSAPVAAGAASGLVLILITTAAEAGLYWFQGVRSDVISLCFVGDAVTSRPDRVDEVRRYLREFEFRINIRFDYQGSCAASVVQSNGTDFFDGDIRVVLPNTTETKISAWPGPEGTGPVPGIGCPMFLDANGNYDGGNNGWGSWSNAPDDLEGFRACLYTLKLGDDPWNAPPYLNHTLHEFGHALGLRHEHERYDVSEACKNSGEGYGGNARDGFLTPFDISSVMNYGPSRSPTCGIIGNYAYTGLSDFDRLSLRIFYPEENRLAEIRGYYSDSSRTARGSGIGMGGARSKFGLCRQRLSMVGK
jgi:hypothetical protein